MRVQLRMNYEMNRELQVDSALSLADYHVLHALIDAPHGRLQVSDLAALIGCERSRASHQLRRLGMRGLVERVPSMNLARAAACFLVAISCSSRLGAAGRGIGRYPRPGRLGGAAPLAGDLFAGVTLHFAARLAVLQGPPDAARRRVHARALWHMDATFAWWPAIEVRRD
jgi:hypothetical protein